MMRHARACFLALVLTACGGKGASSRSGGSDKQVLRLIDSVRVRETEALFVGRLGDVAVGRDGHLFLVDLPESRVVEVARGGEIVRTFGKKGRGPGELDAPDALLVDGDSILIVSDRGQRILSRFSLRTGAFTHTVPFITTSSKMRMAAGELLATQFDEKSSTSLLAFSRTGEPAGAEGVTPALGLKYPQLQNFRTAAFTVKDSDVFAAVELSQSLFRWKRGARTGQEIVLPVVRRHGVSSAIFERLVGNPSPENAKAALDHSVPSALEFIAPDVLGLVTFDPVLASQSFTGIHYLTLVDLAKNQVCADILVPAIRDPLPRARLSADTLIVVQQAADAGGQPATSVLRFHISPAACAWAPLGAKGPSLQQNPINHFIHNSYGS